MGTPKKLITELTALTIIDGEFVLVIHDGISGKQISVSKFLEYVMEQLSNAGYGGSNPGSTAPEDPVDGVTTWVDLTDPTKPVMKLFINDQWVTLTNPNVGDMKASIYDTEGQEVDVFNFIDTEVGTRVHGVPSSTITSLTNHMNNDDVHVSTTERQHWDDASDHVADTAVHASATEKQHWNAAVTHMGDTTIHVSATMKATWNGMVDMDDVNEAIENLQNGGAGSGEGAGSHNSVYRGQKLGESVTDAQWAAIASGDFTDMYIGDYWEIGGIKYRIAAFDYYLHCGDTELTKHHVTIVPDSIIGEKKRMNSSNATNTGYGNSEMFKTNLAGAKTTISNAFGASHVLTHRKYFHNAANNGIATAGSWYDASVDIMSEISVYGSRLYGSDPDDANTVQCLYSIDKSQFPLFKFRHDLIVEATRQWYWLRDVVGGGYFALVGYNGACTYYYASYAGGVRPAFSLIGD